MKNPNHKLLKVANWLLGGILALLGFSACNDEEDPSCQFYNQR